MRPRHAVLEEAIVAAIALALIGAMVAAIYWRATGESPWPGVALAEAFAFTWGLVLVIVTSPSWGR